MTTAATAPGDDAYQSITGVLESAEPTISTSTSTPTHASTPTPTTPSTMRNHPQRALNVSGPSSSATSPLSSRDASPAPTHHRSTAAPGTGAGTGTNPRSANRSRKTSADVSPSRGPTLPARTPTVAAIKRALSASNVPDLPPPMAADTGRIPRPVKPTSASNSGDNTPHWPISPRLRSPPPGDDGRSRSRANSLRAQIRKSDAQSTPAIVVQSSSPAPLSRVPVKEEPVSSDPDEPALSMKAPSRSPSGAAPKLETVQESSLPATPGFDGLEAQSFISSTTFSKTSDEERNDVSSSKVTEDLSTSSKLNSSTNDSGSDGATKIDTKGKQQERRASSIHRPNTVSSKASLTSLSNRARADPPLRNMTVETETVPSVPQASIGQDRSASSRADGSLRLKPSNETIRPKKDKRAPKRKAPSINSGTGRLQHISYHYYIPSRPGLGPRSHTTSSLGSPLSSRSNDGQSMVTLSPPSPETTSSKADVFEQKVASAVDEANSSDSDATFIYESNPPELPPHRSRHQHSRTPSMTSVNSLIDPRLAIRDSHKNPNKKSSMKFMNPYNPTMDGDALDRTDGSMRSGSVRAGGGSHHHHIGRHGVGRGALNHLALDSDSSMPQSSRVHGASSRQTSQPNSPRFQTFHVANANGNGTKKHGELSAYDMDTENADDERTPLIAPGRSPRVRTPRRRNSLTLRQLERRHRNHSGCCRRFAGCLVLSILLLVVVFSSVGLVFATTKPLTDVKIREIQNVIATQDELMLDLIVGAINPNIIGVTVSDMDVLVFAKSKHVGSDKWWREHGNGPPNNEEEWQPIDMPNTDGPPELSVRDGTDEGTDPIEGEPRTMSLGHIFHFDAPLNFDGSFFQRHHAESIGEIRLSHPGNKTEAGGTDRWEEVLQYPFELIIHGNFKYTLPLSTREHKVPVTASYYYDPDIEKKSQFKITAEKVGKKEEEEEKRKESIYPVPTPPRGRYDRRALPRPDAR